MASSPARRTSSRRSSTTSADYLVDLARKNSGDPIPHQVLNARYHEQEAHIIAQAGVPGTVTIATNMAGRGTDIQLGGNARYAFVDWLKERDRASRTAPCTMPATIEPSSMDRRQSSASATNGSTAA